MEQTIKIVSFRDRQPPDEENGHAKLRGEIEWLLTGTSKEEIDAAAEALAGICQRINDTILLVNFGNAVGFFDVPGVGTIEVVSSKWGRDDFNRMLEDLTDIASGLPFSTAGGALPFDRSVINQPNVLYHLFAYLRYVLSEDAPPEKRLLPALRRILKEPHRRFDRTRRVVPIDRVRTADAGLFADIVSARYEFERTSNAVGQRLALARYLKWHLPIEVSEGYLEVTHDTPENRFAKNFLSTVSAVINQVRKQVSVGGSAFDRKLQHDCESMERVLAPIVENGLWRDVGRMVHFPTGSIVLQKRGGYKEVFTHFSKMRLASRVPVNEEDMKSLLEAKNVALLYELWCYFTVAKVLKLVLGAPVAAVQVSHSDQSVEVRRGLRIEWADGTQLLYNWSFSRSLTADWHSYSLGVRPDIVLRVASGPNSGLHILDAKFKVHKKQLEKSDWPDNDELEESVPGFEGIVTRGDIYTMHMYRDAIDRARSAWVLFPGDRMRFYPTTAPTVVEADKLSEVVEGVGAIPLRPIEETQQETYHTDLHDVLRRLLGASMSAHV